MALQACAPVRVRHVLLFFLLSDLSLYRLRVLLLLVLLQLLALAVLMAMVTLLLRMLFPGRRKAQHFRPHSLISSEERGHRYCY